MAFRLFLAGTDRISMVPLESISVTEVGPGGVSSMKFTIEDPTKIITVARLASVGFDPGAVADRLFFGYVTTVTMRPLPVGRTIEIEATGVEAILDWLVGPTLLITAATNFGTAIGNIITNKTANLTIGAPETTQHGDATNPIGSLDRGDGNGAPFMTGGVNWTVPSGTLRWQIEELHRKTAYDATGVKSGFGFLFTIDFNARVRVWEDNPVTTSWAPDDYGFLDVNDNVADAAAIHPEDFEHSVDHGAVPNRVRVVWASGAGFVGTNTYPGIEHVLNDPNILTGAERDIAGANYLLQNATPERGTLRITDWTPPTDIHAGSLIDMVINTCDLNQLVRIMQIDKTFHGTGRQDWTITYGRMGDSFSRSVAQAFGR